MGASEPRSLQQFFDSPGAMRAEFNLSASAIEPVALDELLALDDGATDDWKTRALDYPRRHGAPAIRERVAALYDGLGADDVIMNAGVDEALAMLFLSVVEPGDRVIVLTPSYPPHEHLPAWRGAEVARWPAREENDWVPDLDELRTLLEKPARLVIVTFPQNPTGFMPDAAYADELIECVNGAGALLVADEIYAGLPGGMDLSGSNLAARDERVVSLHGLSKVYGLPGLRVGWMASANREAADAIRRTRDLFNAYIPAPVEPLIAIALDHRDTLIERNTRVREGAVAAATAFFRQHDNLFDWAPPSAGVLTFPRWLGPGGTRALSDRLLEEASLTLAPSECFDAGDRHVRVSVGRRNLPLALERFGEFLSSKL